MGDQISDMYECANAIGTPGSTVTGSPLAARAATLTPVWAVMPTVETSEFAFTIHGHYEETILTGQGRVDVREAML